MRLEPVFFVILASSVFGGLCGCELFSEDEGDDSAQMDETSTWVTIQGGNFKMGDAHLVSAGPVHNVTVQTFNVTRTEITIADYANCVNAGVCTPPAVDEAGCNWTRPGFEMHPVNCVDWHQAKAFCSWFGGRLLSEAEWEYAAQAGGDGRVFPWGMEAPSCQLAVMKDESGAGCGNGGTSPVCSKPDGRTDQGLCDMGGNVYEWVEDNFHLTYSDGNPPTDGNAWLDPDATETSFRVLRGAAYNAESADYLNVANRANDPATVHSDRYGIRCARDIN